MTSGKDAPVRLLGTTVYSLRPTARGHAARRKNRLYFYTHAKQHAHAVGAVRIGGWAIRRHTISKRISTLVEISSFRLLDLVLMRFMASDCTTHRRADNSVMTGIVPYHSASYRAFDAAARNSRLEGGQ
jgi:hypothetical protein